MKPQTPTASIPSTSRRRCRNPLFPMRWPSSSTARCPMCAMASSPCTGASSIPWTSRALRPISRSTRARALWAMCSANITRTAIPPFTTPWCALRRISTPATCSWKGRATSAPWMATALPLCAIPRRAFPAFPRRCSPTSTRTPWISAPILMKRSCSPRCSPAASRTCL